MMFAFGIAVGCAVACLLLFTLAILKQRPSDWFIEANKVTVELLTIANILRGRQAAALEKIEARLASHNISRDAIALCLRKWCDNQGLYAIDDTMIEQLTDKLAGVAAQHNTAHVVQNFRLTIL